VLKYHDTPQHNFSKLKGLSTPIRVQVHAKGCLLWCQVSALQVRGFSDPQLRFE
jgi:hypothetical protein